jgi:hypothetical protein
VSNPTATLMGYHLRIYRREQFWLPAALVVFFSLFVAIFPGEANSLNFSRAFIGFVLPLLAGLLATAAITDDPALELELASARPVWQLLAERLGLLLLLVAATAAAFQVYLAVMGVDMSRLVSLPLRQLAWLVPSLALMGTGSLAALVFRQSTPGALFTALIWLAHLILRGVLLQSNWARYLFLFTIPTVPDSPYLAANQLTLLALSLALALAACWLLTREERYL